MNKTQMERLHYQYRSKNLKQVKRIGNVLASFFKLYQKVTFFSIFNFWFILQANLLLASCISETPKASSKENNTQQYVDFAYDVLTKNALKYTKFEIDPDLTIISQSDTNVTYLEKIDLNYKIFLKTFKYCDNTQPYKYRSIISILGFNYSIDSIHYGTEYSNASRPILPTILTEYTFSFSGKNYVSLFVEDDCINSSHTDFMVLLFDVTDKNNVIPIALPFQGSYGLGCIADFNNDGILDFVYLRESAIGKLTFFSLHGNNFVKDDRYFVLVKNVNDVRKIDVRNSNWFFPITDKK